MPDKYPMTTTVEGARRIERAVRNVLGSADRSGDRQDGTRKADETCWGKLGTRYEAGFAWTEVYRYIGNDDKPDWATVDGGRKGDNSATDAEKNLAIELQKGTAFNGQIVLLRRAPTLAKQASSSDPPTWLSRWEIVAPISPVAQVQCTDAMGNGPTCKAKVYDNFAGIVGDEFEVQVQHITNVGQKFYAIYAGKNVYGKDTYLQHGPPPAKSRGMVLSIMDTNTNLGTVDWDFPKGHNQ